MTFSELREKDVVNIRDCKRIGRVEDLYFDEKNGCIQAVVSSENDRLWGIFGHNNEHEIPWCRIKQIGPDIILVDIEPQRE